MNKDQAVLLYTSDFMTGTITMTHEQRGMYILLLCLQHQKGYLTESEMMIICNNDPVIMDKFINEGDRFYNPRMRFEAEKRSNYCQSRSKNKKGKTKLKNISKSYENDMILKEEEKVKEKKEIKKEKVNPPAMDEFLAIAKTKCAEAGVEFNDYKFQLREKYQAWVEAGWKDGYGKPIMNWKNKIGHTLQYMKPIKQQINNSIYG